MTAHSFLPPSGAAAWSRCAMWPSMNRKFPQADTEESLEGTAAHWVLSEMLAGDHGVTEGQLSPNGVMVTGEMLDGAELAIDTVQQRILLKERITGGLHIEETVKIPIHPECFGTPDIWAYNVGSAHLEILDYKYGHGFVDEFYNPQGLLYMAGIVQQLNSINPLLITVSFTVIQPRCFYRGAPVRTHNYTVQEAAEHLLKLQRAAQAAMSPFPLATTNDECEHCPGRHACDPLQEGAYEAAQFASDRQPHDLSPEAASLELRMLQTRYKMLGARITGLEELTLGNLRAGKRVPHHRVEHGRGRRQWTASPEQIITIGRLLGKDLSKVTVITPSQAEKYIDASVISAYCVNTPGAARLVPENTDQVAKVFGIPGDIK